MTARTTAHEALTDCPACDKPITAEVAYDLTPSEPVPPLDGPAADVARQYVEHARNDTSEYLADMSLRVANTYALLAIAEALNSQSRGHSVTVNNPLPTPREARMTLEELTLAPPRHEDLA